MAFSRWNIYGSNMRSFVFAGMLVPAACASQAPASPPTTAFTGALTSPAAPPSTSVDLYAPLIGSWSVEVTDYGDDGRVYHGTGEWHFSRVLDGRAVQDVWISPPRGDRGPSYTPGPLDRYGTSIRTPLAGGEAWSVVWLNPVHNVEVHLVGRRIGDHIVQEGDQPEGTRLRWTFDELRETGFHWIGERSDDGGRTWRTQQVMVGQRMTAPYRPPVPTASAIAAASRERPAPPDSQGTAMPLEATSMIRALQARGPHASLREGAAVFDWLEGSWDLDCDLFTPEGQRTHLSGEWDFGWIVDGRMMQDALYFFPPGKPELRHGGTSLRMYDREDRQWNVVWFSPGGNFFVALKGGKIDDRIVLHGADTDGNLIRWSFNDIRADAFHWLGEKSPDHGKTWRLEQDMRVRRRR